MNPTHLKVTVPVALAITALLPRAGYYTAQVYTRGYEASAEYLSSMGESLLRKVNLQTVKDDLPLEEKVARAATKHGIPPVLLGALVYVESRKNSDAFSPKGAIGLAQIMPFNAKRCGLDRKSKLWDEETNLDCGAKILSEELTTYQGNLQLALVVYNGGPKAIKGKYKESWSYADKVIHNYAQFMLSPQDPRD